MDIINEASETNVTRLGPNSDVHQLTPRQVLIHIKKARNLFRSKSPYLLWKFGHQESIFDPLEMSTTEDAPNSNASYGPCATSNQSAEEKGGSLGQSGIYGSSVPIPIKNRRHKGSLRDFTWNATVLADVSVNRTFGDIYIFDRDGGFRGYARINLQTDNNRNRRVHLGPQPGRVLDHISGELLIRIRPVESQTFSKEIDLDFSDFSRSQIIAQGEVLGSIYRVQGKNSGKLYAVKVIEGPENLVRVMLRSERVNSPFIVSPIFAIHSEVSASLYVFLDYVCGGTLQSNMVAGLPSFSRAIHYTAELILALEDIGRCSVENFRLHPRKVLLDSLGFVVLVDFGLSYLDVDPTTDISYSAPEELNSSVKTSASNFWTLGVMLFEMTFGFHPFYDTSRAQTMENILHGEVPFPDVSDLESPMDPIRMQIIDLCKKLLLRNPARRNGIAPLNGAVNYIKNHALFVDIDWEAIRRRNYQPLYRPSVMFRSDAAVIADHKQNDADIDELLDNLNHDFAFSDDEEQQEPVQQLKVSSLEGSPASSGTPFPIGSPVVVSSKDSTSVYATPLSRVGSFNSTLSPTSNEGSSKYVTPLSQDPYRSRGSGSRKSGLLSQVLQRKNVVVQPTSAFGRLLQERGLILPTKEQLDWSGRGQHAEYQIIEDIPLKPLAAIGYGGSALVDSVLCRRIKLARKTMICSRRQRLDVLINEVEHLQRLRHPHIVQLVGSYLQGKKFAILLYPATEGNLATFYEMCGPENTAAGLLGHENCLVALHRFFRCLASSLAYIHANTTKHLDIKPQNVLVRWPNEGHQHFRLYLADFGISRHFQSHDLSQTGSLLARTRKYCAPEVYDGEARGRAADVFSLGCIFLEMTTILCGLSIDSFSDHRATSDSGDDSFHANLTRVESWMETMEAKYSSVISSLLAQPIEGNNRAGKLSIFREMLSFDPFSRPLVSIVLDCLGGPGECCLKEREGYIAAMEEDSKSCGIP